MYGAFAYAGELILGILYLVSGCLEFIFCKFINDENNIRLMDNFQHQILLNNNKVF